MDNKNIEEGYSVGKVFMSSWDFQSIGVHIAWHISKTYTVMTKIKIDLTDGAFSTIARRLGVFVLL